MKLTKFLFWTALGLFYPLAAHAQQSLAVQETATTNGIAQTINLCASDGALNVTNATSSGTLSGAFGIEVYNLDASTNTVNCGFDNSVSTSGVSGYYGREVLAGVGVYFGVRQGVSSSGPLLRCMTQNSSGCTRITITQIK